MQDYVLQHEVGKGSYSSVFYSVYKPTGQVVALKCYENENLLNTNRKKSLLREVQALKLLKHPNIIKIFDKIETIKHTYLALEYINSPSLRQYVLCLLYTSPSPRDS